MNTFKSNIYLDYETADRITVDNLKQTFEQLKEDNDRISDNNALNYNKNQAEDYMYNIRLIESIKVVLSYFGEEV